MRAVLDPNVLISALLSERGAPAQLLRRWLDGEFELVTSSRLLEGLERALARPKLASRIAPGETAAVIALLRAQARFAADPADPPARSADPDDDYLVALAEAERAVLVSGDQHLLALGDDLPVRSPRAFLETLGG